MNFPFSISSNIHSADTDRMDKLGKQSSGFDVGYISLSVMICYLTMVRRSPSGDSLFRISLLFRMKADKREFNVIM